MRTWAIIGRNDFARSGLVFRRHGMLWLGGESRAIMHVMARVPNAVSSDLSSTQLDRMANARWAASQRKRVYRWTTDQDEISPDCIMVGIGGTRVDMQAAGLPYEPQASIYWCSQVTRLGFFEAGGDSGPYPVLEALQQADLIAGLMGYAGVVILIDEAGIWRPDWGILAEEEGL